MGGRFLPCSGVSVMSWSRNCANCMVMRVMPLLDRVLSSGMIDLCRAVLISLVLGREEGLKPPLGSAVPAACKKN